MSFLPIDPFLPQIIEVLGSHSNLVLQASPGSGKTTRVPRAFLSAPFLKPSQEIWVLEPRKLAAKYSAIRVADELNEPVGNTVGYQFRFEKVLGAKTRLKFFTEGMFSRLLHSDPSLSSVGIVVLDEFHERNLQTDTAISYLKALQKNIRPDLKTVVMSATMDPKPVLEFLDSSTLISVESPPYPLEISYLGSVSSEVPLEQLLKKAIKAELAPDSQGDTLVFLPGKPEIQRALNLLQSSTELRDFLIVPLHSEVSARDQELALRPQKKRKIILSTNIAETSLTIEGVNRVIDSGLEKQASYSWWNGIPSLNLKKISKASATQRAGRAARTGPGKCVRLYPKSDYEARVGFSTPEILRTDLSSTLLEIRALGFHRNTHFTWFETPSESSVKATETFLSNLGAIDPTTHDLTEAGKSMSQISAPVRISKLLIEAQALGCLESALHLAAQIHEQGLSELDARDSIKKPLSRRMEQLITTWQKHFDSSKRSNNLGDDLSLALLRAFPDRVAKKRPNKAEKNSKSGFYELVLAGGGSAIIEQNHFSHTHEFFLILEAQESSRMGQSDSTAKVRSAFGIQEDVLLGGPSTFLTDKTEVFWNKEQKRLLQSSGLQFGKIILDEAEKPAVISVDNFYHFLKEATGKFPSSISNWVDLVSCLSLFETKEEIHFCLGKLLILSKESSSLNLSPQDLLERLAKHPWTELSLKAFLAEPWQDILETYFLGEKRHLMTQLTPSFFTLPNGRKTPIYYPIGNAPWIQSRIQDFFGLKATPTILNGKVSLTLHLLAPNQRAVQVTQDLSGFWKNHYPQLRKELSRNYPKHAWPEDPSHPVPVRKKPANHE